MGQFEILDILKQRPDKYFCVSELSKKVDFNYNNVIIAMRKLVKNGFVDYKFVPVKRFNYVRHILFIKHKK